MSYNILPYFFFGRRGGVNRVSIFGEKVIDLIIFCFVLSDHVWLTTVLLKPWPDQRHGKDCYYFLYFFLKKIWASHFCRECRGTIVENIQFSKLKTLISNLFWSDKTFNGTVVKMAIAILALKGHLKLGLQSLYHY